ncbi:MAG TPA: mechanosensitive ion channel family protein, partial [Candidatus Binataceae bacterium]|nr:mechanosensitive ion channel family protein [Candidatus Binataceae bacterium]
DLIGWAFAFPPSAANAIGAAGVVLFFCGIVRMAMDVVEFLARRGRRDFSTILRELISALLYAAVITIVMAAYEKINVTQFLASLGVLTVVVGLALQETLGNIFSGLWMQLSKPFRPGDWVGTAQHIGRVQGIGVRSTTIVTRDNERLEIPNSLIAKEVLTNYGNPPVADELNVGLAYEQPPNRVREVIQRVLHDVPHVLTEPAPEIYAWEYGDFAIKYRIKFWLADYDVQEKARDALVTNLWYALRRHGIDIPYPIRTLEMRRAQVQRRVGADFEREMIRELRYLDFLRGLSDEELRVLVPNVQVHQFGSGEILVREGERSDSLYMLRRGIVDVYGRSSDGAAHRLNTLSPHSYFGEMAMMTGQPRGATVQARTDIEVMEIDREAFTDLFREHPDAVTRISEVIAARESDNRELLSSVQNSDGKNARRNWWVAKIREIFDLGT